MRVISGSARGLRLDSPNGQDTRPTLDNVKEAIFSMLFDRVRDSDVLDLFAGSGALGIEALSRGACSCVFADKSIKSVAIVKNNIAKARMKERSKVLKADFKAVLASCAEKGLKFDIIFLDPPYDAGFMYEALTLIREGALLGANGVIVAEFDSKAPLDIQNYKLVKDKRYGRVCINILEAQ